MNIYSQNDALSKLIRISTTVGNDESLLNELLQEIKSCVSGPICSMFKAIFKRNLLSELGLFTDLLSLLFQSQKISEFTLHDSPNIGIKCFFMPKSTIFPLHDHNNQAVCTGVLYGAIRYMALNRVEKKMYRLSTKATAKTSDVLFLSRDFRNIHSIFALEDSVIVDIFIPNNDDSDLNLFKVVKKRGREFKLEEIIVKRHRCCEHKDI